jgi:hypothetical protein
VFWVASQRAPSTGLVTVMPRAVATNTRDAERTEKARISARKDWKGRRGKERRGRTSGDFVVDLRVLDKRVLGADALRLRDVELGLGSTLPTEMTDKK